MQDRWKRLDAGASKKPSSSSLEITRSIPLRPVLERSVVILSFIIFKLFYVAKIAFVRENNLRLDLLNACRYFVNEINVYLCKVLIINFLVYE